MASGQQQTGTVNEAETKLLASALTLFAERGYEGTSIREIIEGAGVTRPVLYYYFENKEDLFLRLVDTQFRRITDSLDEVIAEVSGCRNRLCEVLCRAFQLAEEESQVIRLILQVFFSPPFQGPNLDKNQLARKRFRRIEQIMQEGLEANELSGGDSRSLALAFIGMMDMHIMAKSHRPETRLTKEIGEGLVDLFLEGAGYGREKGFNLVSPFSF